MDWNQLKNINHQEILDWFKDQSWDLSLLGNDDEQRQYLQSIDNIARRTGATNIVMADYILNLEKRLIAIETFVNHTDRFDQGECK